MAREIVMLEISDKIAVLTLNRPTVRNSLNLEMWEMLDACFDRLEAAGDDVRAVVLTGAGDRAFCAGLDFSPENPIVRELLGGAGRKQPDQIVNEINRLRDTFNRLADLPMPTVAALNGSVYGAGVELILCCDMRIATEGTVLSLPEAAVGVVPDMGGTQRLPRLIGLARAKELILTGLPVSAVEAERMGLVNCVVPREKVLETALSLARRIAHLSPVAVRASKRALNQSLSMSLAEGFRYETRMMLEAVMSEDLLEGVRAFQEKRAPEFQGR